MGMIFQFVMAIPKLIIGIIKIAIKTGLIWFAVPLVSWGLYEAISGDMASLGGGFGNPVANVVFNGMWYLCYVLFPLTLLQNIIRMVKKEPKFSILKAIINIGKKKKIGHEAKLDGDTIDANTEKRLSGVVFGKQGKEYITKPETTDGHVLIIGGTGSGKTSAIAIPTLISWKETVFAIDVKGELYENTKAARNQDMIKVFNPEDRNTCKYDPFFMLRKARDISSEARSLALSICPLPPETKESVWIKSAQNMLTGFILYYYGKNLNFSETMVKIKSKPLRDLLDEIITSDNEKAKQYINNFASMADETLFSIYGELDTHITVFATNADLQWALTGTGNCITPEDLETGHDIFCCIQMDKIDEWTDLLQMMCSQFLKFFERRKDAKNKPPILFFIDEFPRLGKIESISKALGTLRANKIHIALIVQSKADLNVHYGEKVATVILDNCNYKAILKASEPNTQEWCSKLVGKYDKEKDTSGVNADMLGMGKGQSTSTTTEQRYIIEPTDFGYLGDDLVCIFPNGYRIIKKIKPWEDKAFCMYIEDETAKKQKKEVKA